jgi:hypothetical protein
MMAGTDHHHHHHHPHSNRREPFFENPYVHTCFRFEDASNPNRPWNDCFGPSKTDPGNGARRRS